MKRVQDITERNRVKNLRDLGCKNPNIKMGRDRVRRTLEGGIRSLKS